MRHTLLPLAALLAWPAALHATRGQAPGPESDPHGRICLEPSRSLISGQDRTWSRRLEAKPDDAEALETMTRMCLDRGKIWAALNFADRWTKAPGLSAQEKERAHLQAGEIRIHLGYFAEAEEDFKRALEINPDNAAALRLSAASMRDKPKEALLFAEKAAGLAAASAAQRAAAHSLAGALRTDLGDLSGAEKSYARALSLAPGDLDALAAMAALSRAKKPEALPFAERAEAAALKTPLWLRGAALRHSARTWLELEDYSRARQNLRRALALNPDDLDALVELVKIKDKPGRTEFPEDASSPPENPGEEVYASLLQENPEDLEALRGLAAAAAARKENEQALGYAERLARAVWRAPAWQQADAYRLSARLWLNLKRPRRAHESADQALDLQPDSVETMEMIIRLEKMGGYEDEYSSASLSYIHYKIAEMRLTLRDFERAEASLKKSQSLGLDDERAKRLKEAIEEAKSKKP